MKEKKKADQKIRSRCSKGKVNERRNNGENKEKTEIKQKKT